MKKIHIIIFVSCLLAESLCQNIDATITARVGLTSALALINTIGICFFYGGLASPKNFVAMMGQIFFIYAEVTIVWMVIGYTLVFGGTKSNFIGGTDHVGLRDLSMAPSDLDPRIPGLLYFMSSNQAAVMAPAFWTGSTIERVRFLSISIFAILWSIIVYTPIAHWNLHPSGFLREMGGDASTANSNNIASGTTALVLAIFCDRIQKKQKDFIMNSLKHMQSLGYEEGKSLIATRKIKKHGRQVIDLDPEDDQNYSSQSAAFVFLGAILIWLSCHIGSASNPLCLINNNLAAVTGLITWTACEYYFTEKYSLVGMSCGALCGLVGINQGGNYSPIYAAAVIGILSAFFSFFFYKFIDRFKLKFDDRLGVFGCHGICGIVGAISFGFFGHSEQNATNEGIYYGGDRLLGVVTLGVVCTFLWSAIVSLILVWSLYKVGLFQMIDEQNPNEELDFDEQAVFLPDIDKIIKKYTARKTMWMAKKSLYMKPEEIGVKTEGNIGTVMGNLENNQAAVGGSGEMIVIKKVNDRL